MASNSPRYFVCGTNKGNQGRSGHSLEVLMHDNHCAAMWEYPKNENWKVHYLEHMKKVENGHFFFMFSRGRGIIGVGCAKDSCQGPFKPGQRQTIRGKEWLGFEWQVPVRWLRWEPTAPCEFQGNNAAFYELKGEVWKDRLAKVRSFYDL